MTVMAVFQTILGGFLLPFAILSWWRRLVQRWQAVGGILGIVLIIGTLWLVNHGSARPLIYQSGPIFIDMGVATAVGVSVFDQLGGGSVLKSLPNISAALLGGLLAGLLLCLF
ncbi:hypothetical protein ABID29_000460 [Streptococcus rupicaprae]|uniref:Uncharacterized protein n=1 Tax=Streptococcus rupicaprae TaxID=759619 RepID=A0ABV2FFL0_9STRE